LHIHSIMKLISLFSGIGGFELAAEWMGWDNIVSCEINPFCRKVLKHHFPNSYHHDDVNTLTPQLINEKLNAKTGGNWRSDDIVLTGGFPCQDISNSKQWNGRAEGISGSRSGLVNEMLRLISEVKPKFIVSENVSNLLKINNGKDFSFILKSISRMGYNAEWRIIHASEEGAPHKRARVYLVAYPNGIRLHEGESFFSYVGQKVKPIKWEFARTSVPLIRGGMWQDKPPVLCMDDGLSKNMDYTSFSKAKVFTESIQAFGNAIVPQIAYNIFKSIEDHEAINK